MAESESPAWEAAVAAPIRKLWPLNLETSSPVDVSAWWIDVTSGILDNGAPDSNKNNEPGVGGLIAR